MTATETSPPLMHSRCQTTTKNIESLLSITAMRGKKLLILTAIEKPT
jgi:hypothetical protein